MPHELQLPYTEFKALDKSELNETEKEWLNEWEMYDLAVSPMDDNKRKILRYGHHIGWSAHREIYNK